MNYVQNRILFAFTHWSKVRLPALTRSSPSAMRLRSASIFEKDSANKNYELRITKIFSSMLTLVDLLFIFDLYEIITYYTKSHTRLLSSAEKNLGKSIFGNSIRWDLVVIDEKALSSKTMKATYVGFNTINASSKMRNAVLIHEFIHVWQYQHCGALYIARALAAQRSKEGYNYAHNPDWRSATSIFDFNAEQMGDIVEDYYLLSHGQRLQWGNGTELDLGFYEKLIEEISW
jgi:hypothetical protein